jgi:hypothetical protein
VFFLPKKIQIRPGPRFLIQNWNFLTKKYNFESTIKKKQLNNEHRGFAIGAHRSDDPAKVTLPA